MATITGSGDKDFIRRAGDGCVVPLGYIDVTGLTIGADTIRGNAGNDILFGDDGSDVLNGGPVPMR